jgi:hypothetical protein
MNWAPPRAMVVVSQQLSGITTMISFARTPVVSLHPATLHPGLPLAHESPHRLGMVLIRAVVWGMIGLVYTPLFLGLTALMTGAGLERGAYVAAAALAGAAGAALYGGREVAILGTGIGVGVGWLSLLLGAQLIGFGGTAVAAAAVAGAVGLSPIFSARCARHVPGKVLAGLVGGALCGAVLAIAEPLHPRPFSIFAVLAFLVSVNGVLYVSTVGRWVGLTRRLGARTGLCVPMEALVIAVLAGLTAGSVWVMVGPLFGPTPGLIHEAGNLVYGHLPMALLGGIFGGALAGALLELFGFAWVHDL